MTDSEKKLKNRQDVRRFRQRLRDAGLVPKEIWIMPQHHAVLKKLEKELQKP